MKKHSIAPGLFRSVVLLFAFVLPLISFSQQPVKFIDEETSAPISGVAFKYSDQSGFSDEDGLVLLKYKTGEMLHLSHISYGQWNMNDAEVSFAIQNGFVRKQELVVGLMPVTVLAVRKTSNEMMLL